MADGMKINDLSRLTGFGVSTIYEYLRSGLLQQPKKQGPTKSYFDESHVDRLRKIKDLKTVQKLSLDEIKQSILTDQSKLIETADVPGNVKIMLIDKALALFSEKGYEHTRISDITDALDMGSGTFYRFFHSKEELLIGCMDRLPKVLIPKSAWAKVRKEKDYIKRLRHRGYAMMNAFPSYIGILNHIKLLLAHDDKEIAAKAAECLQNVVTPLRDELKYAIKEGSVRAVDEDLVPFILLGINSIYGDRMLVDSKYTVDEAFSVIEDFVYHALVNKNKERKDRWESVDLSLFAGDTVAVSDLRFNELKTINGAYKGGELSFHVNDIKDIQIRLIPNGVSMTVIDVNDLTYDMETSNDVQVSGHISNGVYSVSLNRVSRIEFA